MRLARVRVTHLLVIAVGTSVVTLGCSPSEKPQSESEKNLQTLARLYGRFISQNRGAGPPNEAAFKKYIRALPPEDLSTYGIDSSQIDSIFVSPRDSQPYGIAYNVKGGVPGPEGAPMIIWEQTGVGGKRYVADFVGKIEEVDEATFNQRLAAVKPSKK